MEKPFDWDEDEEEVYWHEFRVSEFLRTVANKPENHTHKKARYNKANYNRRKKEGK